MQYEPGYETVSLIRDLLLSWIASVFLASIFINLFTLASSQHFNHGNDYWLHGYNILKTMLGGLFILFPLGVIVTAPFLFIASLISVVFRRSIEKNLAVWCWVAPFSIWLFWIFVNVFTCDNNYCQAHSFAHVFYRKMISIDNLLFLFGPMPASAIFYFFRIRKRYRRINATGN